MGDVPAQLDLVSRAAGRGGDSPGNGYTTFGQAEQSLRAFGLPVVWTDQFDQAIASPWALCLVADIELRPAQYPPSWFGWQDTPDHFILWLPRWRGTADWFNDPLAADEQDCRYDLASVSGAWGGAYILPSTGHGEDTPALVPAPTSPVRRRLIAQCGLKAQPQHGGPNLALIPPGGQVLDLGPRQAGWAAVQFRDRQGWVPANLVANIGGAA